MGLAVKTDGAAVASGAITEALIYADAAARGINYDKGWIVGTTTTIKIFIDIFIGVWAFLLAYIWTRHIEPRKPGDKLRAAEIWERFPKFVLGFVAHFLVVLLIGLASSPASLATVNAAMDQANVFRQLFFVLTFFSIGLMSDLRVLWQEGIGRLAAVYVVSLFGFVIWVGLLISWIFFSGLKPPITGLDLEEILQWRPRPTSPASARRSARSRPSRCCPIEKKLIAGSLILGVVLLVILIWTGNSSLPIGR